MEHVLLPSDSLPSEWDTVPWLGGTWDRGIFDGYILRHDVPGIELIRRKPATYRVAKPYRTTYAYALEKPFQDWLFFGILTQFFGEDFDETDFTKYDSSGSSSEEFICTSRLSDLLDDWVQRHSSWKAEKSGAEIRNIPDEVVHLHSCLKTMAPLLWAVKDSSFDSRIRLSIVTTMELLWSALEQCFGDIIGKLSFSAASQFDSLRDQEMMARGWCPFLIFQARFHFSTTSAIYFTSRLQKGSDSVDHSFCSKHVCKRSNVVFESLQKNGLIHRPDCNGCEERGVVGEDLERLIALLKEGSIPLLRFSWALNDDSNFKIELVPFTGRQRYTAISHVWADGLGNPLANRLRSCQLCHVTRLVRHLVKATSRSTKPERLFYCWMDTLCCPVNDPEARTQAIVLMRETYRRAQDVLVLDAELQRSESRGMSKVEMAARILSCGWARRLWTFQEVALAQRPWVQFADEVIDLHALARDVSSVANSKDNLRERNLANGMLGALQGLVSINKQFTLQRVVRGIEDRLVTRPGDEPLCIAPLLGLDLKPIASARGLDRIKEFWNSMAKSQYGIPRDIIFTYTRKINVEGYRWAPVTLRHRTTWELMTLGPRDEAILKSDGLHIILPGGVFSPNPCLPKALTASKLLRATGGKLADQVWVRDRMDRWWDLSSFSVVDEIKGAWTRDAHERDVRSQYAIILQLPGRGKWISGDLGGRHQGIIMRCIQSVDEGGIHVGFLDNVERVGLHYCGELMSKIMSAAFQTSEEIRKSEPWIYASSLNTSDNLQEGLESAILQAVREAAVVRLAEPELQNHYKCLELATDEERTQDFVQRVVFMLAGTFVTISSTLYSEHKWIIDP